MGAVTVVSGVPACMVVGMESMLVISRIAQPSASVLVTVDSCAQSSVLVTHARGMSSVAFGVFVLIRTNISASAGIVVVVRNVAAGWDFHRTAG